MKKVLAMSLFALCVAQAHAGESTLDAAVGGGVGGALGAALGNELGGRDGAIIGGALGGGIGAAVNTDHSPPASIPSVRVQHGAPVSTQPRGVHCPPGQAKKGRC